MNSYQKCQKNDLQCNAIPKDPPQISSISRCQISLSFQIYYKTLQICHMERLQVVSNAISLTPDVFDYIVVGAGVSGLQAVDILALKPNTSILVLQAHNALGGRIGSVSIGAIDQAQKNQWVQKNIDKINATIVEKGATWIEERHTVMRQLCRQFGITLREQHSVGHSIYLTGDRPFTPAELMKHPEYADNIRSLIELIDSISYQYNQVIYSNLQLPTFEARKMLKKYDGITLEEFLKDGVPDKYADVRNLFDSFFEHTECINSSYNSMHEVLTKNARSNDLGILKEFLGDFGHEPSYLINGGTELLIQGFVDSIENKLKRPFTNILKLSHQVITIDNRAQGSITIVAETDNRVIKKFKCKHVICAAPLAVSRTIAFTNISTAKKIIIDNQLRTNAVKSFMFTKTPFWRRDSNGKPLANGDCLFSDKYFVNMCHDISPLDESCGIIVFFHNGKRLDAWEATFSEEDDLKKKQYFISLMSKLFNVQKIDQARLFEDCFYYESSYMTDQFIRSGFQSNTRPGTFSQVVDMGDSLNALYRDQNGITFIGSEYSLQFASYMEGAVRITREKIFKLIGKPDPLSHLQIENKVAH